MKLRCCFITLMHWCVHKGENEHSRGSEQSGENQEVMGMTFWKDAANRRRSTVANWNVAVHCGLMPVKKQFFFHMVCGNCTINSSENTIILRFHYDVSTFQIWQPCEKIKIKTRKKLIGYEPSSSNNSIRIPYGIHVSWIQGRQIHGMKDTIALLAFFQ